MNSTGNAWLEPAGSWRREPIRPDPAEETESLFGLTRTLLANLWRWRALILALVVAGLIAAALLLSTIPSSYIARADVYFDFSRQSVVSDLPAESVAPSSAMLNTEMEILASRNLMNVAVEELGLLDDPEFNPWLLPDGTPAAPAEIVPPEEDLREVAVSTLLSQIGVSMVADSYVFSITVETLSPRKSAEIANGIANLFIAERVARRMDASEDAITWLEQRTSNLRDRVREAEARVAQERALAFPGSESALSATAMQIASGRERVAGLEIDATRLEALESRLGTAPEGGLEPDVAAALGPVAADLAGRIAEAAGTDPDAYAALVAEARDRVAAEAAAIRADAERVQGEVDALLETYTQRTSETQALRDSERDAAASLAAYEAMLERLKGRVAVGALDPFWPEATIISPAVPPAFASSPDRELILAMGGLGSLVAASGIALLLSALFPVVGSGEELERVTGAPALAQMPIAPRARLGTLRRRLRRRRASRLADGVRTARIALGRALSERDHKLVLLTAAKPGRDTASAGYLLAQSFAQAGRRILLVDALPAAGGLLSGRSDGATLETLLDGTADPAGSIARDASDGFDILRAPGSAAGETDPQADMRAERARLDGIAGEYDLVLLLAAAPIHSRPDAQLLARLADAVLLIVRQRRSRPDVVSDALDALAIFGTSRAATILLTR